MGAAVEPPSPHVPGPEPAPPAQDPTFATDSAAEGEEDGGTEAQEPTDAAGAGTAGPGEGGGRRRRRRRRRGMRGGPVAAYPGPGMGAGAYPAPLAPGSSPQAVAQAPQRQPQAPPPPRLEPCACEGVLEMRQDGSGFLRSRQHDLAERREDPLVPQALVQRFGLREGCFIAGRGVRSPQKPGPRLEFIETIEGAAPAPGSRQGFRKLVVIDPDFHYELGTFKQENELSMRVVDLLCPIGRGQRGLIVAPPRTGKTTLLMNIAAAMEGLYPDVHLIVLLVDERPEEGTYWKRNVQRGEVYVSTMDETPEHHVRLSQLVQHRAERLVETGKEVMILLDSITRMTRAFNNVLGGKNARTMSGGLDARVFTQPKQFFGAARNTENGGSLTILATTLVDTGSKMDQVIFEEFKGTGNMELTLDRRLADRRIFPAIDIEHTGTRKEERLLSRTTLKKVDILRRVLSRLKPREAMEMLADRLGRYASNQEFLNAFSLDDVQ